MVNTPKQVLHIVSIDDEIIPAMSEKLVDGFIERPEADILGEDSMLVETNVAFRDRFGCLLTPVIVNTAGQVSTCIPIFNPFPQPVLIPGEVTMGHLEPVEVLQVVKEKENIREDQNFGRSRRVVFTPGDSKRDVANVNPLVSEPARKMHVSHRCMSVEFLAGARRAPRKNGMHVIASQGAEASQWTEIMFADKGADASQSTKIITSQGTEIINGDASHVAEASQWTEILNGEPR